MDPCARKHVEKHAGKRYDDVHADDAGGADGVCAAGADDAVYEVVVEVSRRIRRYSKAHANRKNKKSIKIVSFFPREKRVVVDKNNGPRLRTG